MHRLLLGLSIAIAMALVGVGDATAARRVALVIANSDYPQAPLANPKVDSGVVGPALEKAGFEVTTIVDADLDTFDEALQKFHADADGADVALFYFSGHGFAVADGLDLRTMLMSTSANLTSQSARVLRGGGISLEEITLDISSVAKTSLFFIDACRNDPKVRAVGGGTRIIPVVKDIGAKNIFIGLSTRLGSTASDGVPGEGTAFARAFADHIAEPGMRIEDQFREIRRQVEDETKRAQRPEIGRSDLDEDVILVASADPVPQVPAADSAPQMLTRSVSGGRPCTEIISKTIKLSGCVDNEWVASEGTGAQEFTYLTADQNFGLMVITEKDVFPASQFRDAIIANAVAGSTGNKDDVKIISERIESIDGKPFNVLEYTIPNDGNPILFQNFYYSLPGYGSVQILGYSLASEATAAAVKSGVFASSIKIGG